MVVEIQAVNGPEPVSQGWAEQGEAGGGTNQGETRQVQTQALGAGALADDDIQSEIFQGGVEYFFYRSVETMDFVDEQDVVAAQVGQDCR